MKLLVYRPASQNNVLTAMAEQLAVALSRAGVEARLLPMDGADWGATLAGALSAGGFDQVLSFGSFGADLVTPAGQSIYDAVGCGFIGWDVDHPAYQFARFTTPIARRLQICASRSHFDFARGMGCRTSDLLAFPAVEAVSDEPLPIEARPVLATVAMSWLGQPTNFWAQWKGTPAFALVDQTVARLVADPEEDLLAAFRATVAETGLDLALDKDVCNLLGNVGLFVRQYDRVRLAQSLVHAGVPCVIYGRGWSERLGEHAHITYQDDQHFSALARLYETSRIVINLNGANGGSERAVQGMAAGALVVSDYSPALRDAFERPGALRFFDRRQDTGLRDALEAALSAPDAQATADRGRALAAQAHGWPQRAAQIVQALGG